jgi:hypothetical protein
MRGATMASETATAQTIKNQWGTLRFKRMQREIQRYCRDSHCNNAGDCGREVRADNVCEMTGLQYMTDEQKQQAQQMLE